MSLAPSRLEYGLAFDLACATWGNGPALAVVSTPEFVDLAIARAWGGVLLWCEDPATFARAEERLAAGFLPPAAREQSGAWLVENADLDHVGVTVRHAIWAAPQAETWRGRVTKIENALPNGGTLTILTATTLGNVLSPLRRGLVRGEPASIAPLHALFTSGAWRAHRVTHFGGLLGVVWAIAGRVAAVAGRPDISDRAERAHHAAVSSAVGASFQLTHATRIDRGALR